MVLPTPISFLWTFTYVLSCLHHLIKISSIFQGLKDISFSWHLVLKNHSSYDYTVIIFWKLIFNKFWTKKDLRFSYGFNCCIDWGSNLLTIKLIFCFVDNFKYSFAQSSEMRTLNNVLYFKKKKKDVATTFYNVYNISNVAHYKWNNKIIIIFLCYMVRCL